MTSLVVAGLAYLEVYVPPHEAAAPGQERFVDGIGLGLGGALNTASVAKFNSDRSIEDYVEKVWQLKRCVVAVKP